MTTIEVRIDADLLRQAEEILAEKYDMTIEEAIVLFIDCILQIKRKYTFAGHVVSVGLSPDYIALNRKNYA